MRLRAGLSSDVCSVFFDLKVPDSSTTFVGGKQSVVVVSDLVNLLDSSLVIQFV